ncbi:MAG: hypothetical protein CVV47_07590 [Spirochaetae bacterium HGW-Spirochaetae-3]|nr:MAG: hypothetical protein CVV47_07590 [Spirochaetae bacterium HGW-Spirochaetae-3]
MRIGFAARYVLGMNLSFLKLRVADCPWILFDRYPSAVHPLDGGRSDEPPWASIAVDICSRSKGASAVGIVVIGRDAAVNVVRAWDSRGNPLAPPPAAALCASRLLFDAGRGGADSVSFMSMGSEIESMAIDSRTLGLSVGVPVLGDGSPVDGAFGALGAGLRAASGSGVAIPLRIGGEDVDVALFDLPPARRIGSAPIGGRVEAFAVSRQELRVRRAVCDPVVAAAASTVASVIADYADRETAVLIGRDRLVVQWPEGGPVFVASTPEYCLSGEFWVAES